MDYKLYMCAYILTRVVECAENKMVLAKCMNRNCGIAKFVDKKKNFQATVNSK